MIGGAILCNSLKTNAVKSLHIHFILEKCVHNLTICNCEKRLDHGGPSIIVVLRHSTQNS